MIPIQNIYYMLSYTFRTLNEQGYKKVATEEFHNTAELCAAILIKGITVQIKRGLNREYIPRTETLSALRGKIDMVESAKMQTMLKKQMVCSYDDFLVNSYLNRILKSTMALLLSSDISKVRKKELRKLMAYFGEIDILDVYSINWKVYYNRNNQTYRMLISVCYLIVKGLLQTNSAGTIKLMDFLDEQRMSRLYEKFILEYYRKEFPEIKVSASQIPWSLDDGFDDLLPIMQSDIMLAYKEKILIIDAKYYSHTTQMRYGTNTLYSNNLYQIFTYVKNMESGAGEKLHEISGMLLYARTDEKIQLQEHVYQMSGNKIIVRTLDLGCEFAEIAKQLKGIVRTHFGL